MTTGTTTRERNPYAPPAARLGMATAAGHAEFYIVSRRKFVLLFVATVGLYQLYWFYRHWKQYGQAHQKLLWPVPRAIFAIFFTHSLVRNIRLSLRLGSRPHRWAPRTLATIFVILQIASNILDRLSSYGIGTPASFWASLLVLVPLGATLLSIQGAANVACGDPAGSRNSRLTAANWAWLGLGGLFWALLLARLLSPEQSPA